MTDQTPFQWLREVMEEAHAAEKDVYYNTTDLTEEEYRKKLSAGGTTFFAVVGQKPVGTMTITVEKSGKWYLKKRSAALRLIAVSPSFQKKGIAGRMIDASVDWALQHGIDTLFWTAAYQNRSAIATATKYGFAKTDYLRIDSPNRFSVRLVRWLSDRTPSRLKIWIYYLLRKTYVRVFGG